MAAADRTATIVDVTTNSMSVNPRCPAAAPVRRERVILKFVAEDGIEPGTIRYPSILSHLPANSDVLVPGLSIVSHPSAS